jgi:hypothetical protein
VSPPPSSSPIYIDAQHRHLKPGGWCEFKDWDFTLHSVDNSLPPDSHLIKHHQLLYQALGKIGLDWDTGRNLKRWVEDAGFENVEEQVLVVPIGTWPKDKHYVRHFSSLSPFCNLRVI